MIWAFLAIAAVFVAEVVLSMTWNRWYFTFGVPIFIRRIDRPRGLADVSLEELEKSSATAAGAPLVFRRLDERAIAFREKPFGGLLHYAPLMRGVMRAPEAEAAIVVMGLMNWTFIALLTAFAILLGRGFKDVAIYFAISFGVLYLIQGVRFARVAKKLRSATPVSPSAMR